MDDRVVLSRRGQLEVTMTATYESELRAALNRAITAAIRDVGLATFKATSMFGSNGRVLLSKAA